MSHDRPTKQDLINKGLVEVSPGVWQKPIKKAMEELVIKGVSTIGFTTMDPTRPQTFSFQIDPMRKPRMTVGDKANYRPVTQKYWKFKEELNRQATEKGFVVPANNFHLIFYIPMPKSWSKKKKVEMYGKPHQQVPDKDNLEKAFLDCLCENDAYVYDSRVSKFWGYDGLIKVKTNILDGR